VAAIRDAAFEVGHPKDSTRETIRGENQSNAATTGDQSCQGAGVKPANGNEQQKGISGCLQVPLLIARQRLEERLFRVVSRTMGQVKLKEAAKLSRGDHAGGRPWAGRS
jgi:hypothetical protein